VVASTVRPLHLLLLIPGVVLVLAHEVAAGHGVHGL